MKMKMKNHKLKQNLMAENQYEELIIVPVDHPSPYPLYQPSSHTLSNQNDDTQRLLADWLNDDEAMGYC